MAKTARTPRLARRKSEENNRSGSKPPIGWRLWLIAAVALASLVSADCTVDVGHGPALERPYSAAPVTVAPLRKEGLHRGTGSGLNLGVYFLAVILAMLVCCASLTNVGDKGRASTWLNKKQQNYGGSFTSYQSSDGCRRRGQRSAKTKRRLKRGRSWPGKVYISGIIILVLMALGTNKSCGIAGTGID